MTNAKAKKKKTGSQKDPSESRVEADSLEKIPDEILETYPREEQSILKMLFGVTAAAAKFISKSTWASEKVGDALFSSPERLKMMQEAGASLRDLREVAGLTRRDVSKAVNLSDESFLTAVENGTATLSFELILRLAALLARHDPIPFIIKFIRTYNPGVWGVLKDWGLEKFPLQFERERQFIIFTAVMTEQENYRMRGFCESWNLPGPLLKWPFILWLKRVNRKRKGLTQSRSRDTGEGAKIFEQ